MAYDVNERNVNVRGHLGPSYFLSQEEDARDDSIKVAWDEVTRSSLQVVEAILQPFTQLWKFTKY